MWIIHRMPMFYRTVPVRLIYAVSIFVIAAHVASVAMAQTDRTEKATRRSTVVTITTHHDFKTLVERLEKAIIDNDMLLVARASASAGAAKRGIQIPGDAVLLVFRNDFAVRMLRADVAAGIEAPIPIHVIETTDGKAAIAYRRPSTVFNPYGREDLDDMASELDKIFDRIITEARRSD